jgi:hypothetical protein
MDKNEIRAAVDEVLGTKAPALRLEIPKNRWMNDSTVLAQFGHFLGGYGIITTLAYHGAVFRIVLLAAALIVLYALIKEFWYDANYELPKQTFFDNALDFTFWCLGTIVGVVGVWAHVR